MTITKETTIGNLRVYCTVQDDTVKAGNQERCKALLEVLNQAMRDSDTHKDT